jgi:hypothetical protein
VVHICDPLEYRKFLHIISVIWPSMCGDCSYFLLENLWSTDVILRSGGILHPPPPPPLAKKTGHIYAGNVDFVVTVDLEVAINVLIMPL